MSGHIEQISAKTWRLTVSAGFNAVGKRIRHRKTVKATSRRDAERQLALFTAEVHNQMVPSEKTTLAKFMVKWFQLRKSSFAPKTLLRYREFTDRILQALGHLRLDQIKPQHLLEFYENLREDGIRKDGRPGGLDEQTIKHHHQLLVIIFNDAIEWHTLVTNPATRISKKSIPKPDKKQVDCYDEKQAAEMLDKLSVEPLKWRTLITLLLTSGARVGEILGLEWSDVDFDKHTITIERASQYLHTEGTFTKSTKTEKVRTVVLPPFAVQLLKEHKERQLEIRSKRISKRKSWEDSNRLFTQADGRPMSPSSPNQWFGKFLHKHSLPKIAIHALRHTSATLMIAQGLHPKTISGRLGHSDIGITMNLYGHHLESADWEAADKLDKLFRK